MFSWFRIPGVTPASLSIAGSPRAKFCHRCAVFLLCVELALLNRTVSMHSPDPN